MQYTVQLAKSERRSRRRNRGFNCMSDALTLDLEKLELQLLEQ